MSWRKTAPVCQHRRHHQRASRSKRTRSPFAIARIRAYGKVEGNLELRGHRYRLFELDRWPLKITLEDLVSPAFERDVFSLLEVRHRGERVFRVRWNSTSLRVMDYKAGDWERRL